MSKPVKMHVTYRPKKGAEETLLDLVKKHGPALLSTELIVGGAPIVYSATDKRSGQKFFIEMFSWRDDQAANIAHQMPEVMAVWEPMAAVLDSLELAVIESVSGTD